MQNATVRLTTHLNDVHIVISGVLAKAFANVILMLNVQEATCRRIGMPMACGICRWPISKLGIIP
eukprot:COSAG02_NODE_74_length_41878_cov_9.737954_23_plen_65_part_00